MQKIYTLILFTCFFLANNYAQHGIGLLERNTIENTKDTEVLSLLVKGDAAMIKSAASKHNANLKYQYGDLAAIDIEKQYYADFMSAIEDVDVQMPSSKGHLLLDTALIHNNIVDVHAGTAPLSQAYTGEGVVVGILDAGIYFQHDDFKKPNGDTRIRYIWDQNLSSNLNPPQPYDYGEEWSWIDIDNGVCNHIEPSSQNGHGTTVAGVACGNGLATGMFKGVAPESEIIAVAVNFNDNNFLQHVVDGIDYCFKKADALGKPCVVNTSVGTYFGSHDGKDLSAQLIDAMLEERGGRAVVAAAGNGNNIGNASSSYKSTHLSYEVTSDTAFTWFSRMSNGNIYFDLWADTVDFNDVDFAIANDDTSTLTLMGSTDFFNIKESFVGDLDEGVFLTRQSFSIDNGFQGTVEMYAEQTAGRYHLEVLITPVNSNHLWRFMTTGSGTFDIWSSATFQGTSNMVQSGLPPNFVFPAIDNYKLPDDEKTIVSSWQCSDKVITVGNFANSASYIDVDTNVYFTGLTPGEIVAQSSEGPTRDGRLKPDISATGNFVLSSGNPSFINAALGGNRFKVGIGGQHNRNGGTSTSSPVVAGAVALYLEKSPDAYWYETKEVFIRTARKDDFTGAIANTQYGHGKLDGFEAMQYDAIVGCMDPSAFNYNPLANIDDGSCIARVYGCIDVAALNYDANANTDDGSCIPVVYGCMDSLALNYDTLANIDNDSCVYDTMSTSIDDVEVVHFSIFPNPVSEYTTITYQNIPQESNVVVYDIIGNRVDAFPLQDRNGEKSINASLWHSGIYLVRIENKANTVSQTLKLIVR
ncbi:MAG: S8 family serine peptidase [Chitinophagales bacterium]